MNLGIWTENPVREPYVSVDEEVGFVNADASGIFVPAVPIWSYVEEAWSYWRYSESVDRAHRTSHGSTVYRDGIYS